jgi:translation elongation factor EF-1beta
MGKAMVVYRVYPEEGVDLAKLVDDLSKVDKVKSIKREPIAFGLEVVKVGALVDDKKDKPEEVEDNIRKVPGVREVESIDVTLIS